jgi:hypothetical protein
MRTRRGGAAKSAAGEPAVRHAAKEFCYADAALDLRLFRGDRTSVSADCRRPHHREDSGKGREARAGVCVLLGRKQADGRYVAPACRCDLASRLAIQARIANRFRNAAQRLPDATHLFGKGSRPQQSPSSSKLRGGCVLRLLSNSVRSDDDTLTLTQKDLAKMLGVRCLDRDPRRPRSAESRADPLPRARQTGFNRAGAGGGFVVVLQAAASGCSRAPMSDSWRPPMSQTCPGPCRDLFSTAPDGTLACVAHSTVM